MNIVVHVRPTCRGLDPFTIQDEKMAKLRRRSDIHIGLPYLVAMSYRLACLQIPAPKLRMYFRRRRNVRV